MWICIRILRNDERSVWLTNVCLRFVYIWKVIILDLQTRQKGVSRSVVSGGRGRHYIHLAPNTQSPCGIIEDHSNAVSS
jgi:hypothetical protein